MSRPFALLAVPFFTSGVAALAYQVCWQRMLFTAFGVDIESITVIVSTFMFGLGAGALAGGKLADCFPHRIVLMFGLAEVGIGLFGLASPHLIAQVGLALVAQPLPVIGLANFLLLLIPTSMMGATLPMLVAFLVARTGNVGVSIGSLYFVNTMGAAIGAAATGFLVFHFWDLRQTVQAAAALNLLASVLVFAAFGKHQQRDIA